MLRTKLLATALAATLWANHAVAGVALINGGGTGGNVASGTASGAATLSTGVTTVDIPIGSAVWIVVGIRANQSCTFTDSTGGNTYTAKQGQNSGQSTDVGYSKTVVDIPIGSTFSTTCGSSVVAKAMIVAAVSGTTGTPHDAASPAAAGGASTTPSVGPMTPACTTGAASCEILFAAYSITVTNSPTDPGWCSTSLGTFASTAQASLHACYAIVSSNTAQTYNPTNATSGTWVAQMDGFIAAATSPNTARPIFHAVP